jgi:hypothetical protein
MFPGPNDHIIYNDAGEVLGWEPYPTWEDFWCDDCGIAHTGFCVYNEDYDEEEDTDGNEI